jgi:hypothetical protein
MVRANKRLQSACTLSLEQSTVVADALSQKSHCTILQSLLEDGFNLMHPAVLCNILLSCSLEQKIIESQKIDKGIFHIKEKMKV